MSSYLMLAHAQSKVIIEVTVHGICQCKVKVLVSKAVMKLMMGAGVDMITHKLVMGSANMIVVKHRLSP
jgi:O-acetyl-ADP-ribose deacetylase (regulator of RNase III)